MSAAILRRQIHPEVRVLDESKGLVRYIASDETLDSMNEAIKASGWDTTGLAKNAPFVDSHNYNTIDNCLGKITDAYVDGRRLINEVQWAIDVPSNELAQRGFAMTARGYLKACSVGFIPTRAVSKYGGDPDAWQEAMEAVGLDEDSPVRCIYLEQRQIELSACVLGCNPNAVALAHKSGILTDSDIRRFWPSASRHTSHKTFSFPSPQNSDPVERMLNVLTSPGERTPKQALETIHKERNGQSESALLRAVESYQYATAAQHQRSGLALATKLMADDELGTLFVATLKRIGGRGLRDHEREVLARHNKTLSEATAGTIGAGVASTQLVSDAVMSYVQAVGAFRTLGVAPCASPQTKVALVTTLPTPVWQSQDQQPDTMNDDAALTGSNVSGKVSTVGVVIAFSRELFDDESISSRAAIFYKLGQGCSYGIDIAAFNGTGTPNSTTDGGFTGIFPSAAPNVNAGPGNTTAANLQRADFLSLLPAVNSFALTNACRYWLHPVFMAPLLAIKDGPSGQMVVKTPLETGSDEWSLAGFPATWTNAAPSATAPGSQVCAFGYGDGYVIAMRQELELMSSIGGTQFGSNLMRVRALMRARCDMAQSTYFAILKLAAN